MTWFLCAVCGRQGTSGVNGWSKMTWFWCTICGRQGISGVNPRVSYGDMDLWV